MTNPSIPSIAQTFKAGDKLAGCYTLKEALAPQGFCFVWLAHDEELNKDIVLHFVPDSVAADSRAMSELKQEAKRNRQLIHPRIIRVHDLVEDEKWAAVSMDHVPDETYAALQKKRDKRAFAPSEVGAALAELCQTLEDAHRIDLFHRDLTLENILSTGTGVMVQKFGISRVILDSLARGGQEIQASRDIACISPQQLDGERPGRADDIYTLGASIFDLLTGTPPFHEGDIIPQIRKSVPPLVSERRAALKIAGESIPKAWDEVVAACLAKNPEERPKSAAEVGSRLASGKAGAAIAGAVAAGAAVAAGVAAASESKPPGEGKESPKGAAPAPESTGKSQKRPWAPGPGKAPVITEATVLSKTAVPKGETKGEPKAESKSEGARESGSAKASEAAGATGGPAKKAGPGPTTPTGFPLRAFVEVEGAQPRAKGKSSAGLIAAGVVLLLILIVGYLVSRNNSGSNPAPETAAAVTGSNAEASGTPSSESTPPPSPVEAAASTVPLPVNTAAAPLAATPAPAPGAANPAGSEPPAPSLAALAAMTDAQAQQLMAEKTSAVDQARAALADAQKAAQAAAAAQTQAASAVQEMQAPVQQKTDAAAAAKKAADAAAATLKEQQDALQKAQADADAAQKAAAAKAQAADQLRQTVQDAQTAAEKQQAALKQAQTDADQVAKALADRQQAAAAAAKAAADAEAARQQHAQELKMAEASLGQTQTALDKARNTEKARQAAEEAARIQAEREAETARLTAQAAAAAKAAADAQKALDAAKQAVAAAEKAQAAAEQQAAAARSGIVPLPTAPATPEESAPPTPAPAPTAPAATPPASASPSPAAPGASPTLSVHAPNPNMKVDQALNNSLGMRFAPVGKVLFSIWLTRVQDFEAFAKATGFSSSAWQNPGFKQAPDHPVVNVSWNDANQFCLWLTEKEHHEGILALNETYRLPTDVEWSNAVGLPTETGHSPESRDMDVPDVYPWGTQWPPPAGAGNYTGEETDSDVAIKGYNDGFAWTSPVGSFNANKFGLFDMGGNVWEWCADWWNSEQKAKVLRGASWYNGALKLSLLSSCRSQAGADQRSDNYGFRVVIAEEMKKPRTAKPGAAKPGPAKAKPH